MINAVIYARISQDRTGAGLGVDRQEQDCRDLAERLGLTVTAVLTDNDLSAYGSKPRPGYLRLLELIRAGEATTVLTWHTDRLHRHPRELEDYIDACEKHTVPTRTVKAGKLDLSTPAGRMVARMLGATARYESELKADRQKAKHLEIARAGKPSGGMRPYGYAEDRISIVDNEAAVVREIASRLLAGESLRGVAGDLNVRKISSVSGVPWSPAVIRSMIVRPRLVGLREHLGITYPAVWQPILPMDTHVALVALMSDSTRRRRTAYTGRVHLLAGILRCTHDDTPLTTIVGALSRPPKSRVAYRCETCGQSVSQHYSDEMVIKAVLKRIATAPVGQDETASNDDEEILLNGPTQLEELGRSYADGMPIHVVRAAAGEISARMDAARERLAERARVREGILGLPMVAELSEWRDLPLPTARALVSHWLPGLKVSRPQAPGRRFEGTRISLGVTVDSEHAQPAAAAAG